MGNKILIKSKEMENKDENRSELLFHCSYKIMKIKRILIYIVHVYEWIDWELQVTLHYQAENHIEKAHLWNLLVDFSYSKDN